MTDFFFISIFQVSLCLSICSIHSHFVVIAWGSKPGLALVIEKKQYFCGFGSTQQENCVLNWHFWVDEIQQLVEFYKFSSSNAATLITLDTFQCLWGPSQFPSWHSGQMWKFRVAGPVATVPTIATAYILAIY